MEHWRQAKVSARRNLLVALIGLICAQLRASSSEAPNRLQPLETANKQRDESKFGLASERPVNAIALQLRSFGRSVTQLPATAAAALTDCSVGLKCVTFSGTKLSAVCTVQSTTLTSCSLKVCSLGATSKIRRERASERIFSRCVSFCARLHWLCLHSAPARSCACALPVHTINAASETSARSLLLARSLPNRLYIGRRRRWRHTSARATLTS